MLRLQHGVKGEGWHNCALYSKYIKERNTQNLRPLGYDLNLKMWHKKGKRNFMYNFSFIINCTLEAHAF